jgi:hypothetical protein
MQTRINVEEFVKQSKNAVRRIAARAPYIYDENCGRTRPSRRIQGLWTVTGDRQGHKNVFIYIEKGLENMTAPIAIFLAVLMQHQQTHGYSASRTFIASFGGENDELERCPLSLRTDSVENAERLANQLCNLSSGSHMTINSPSVIKAFTNIAMNTLAVGPTSEDIVVIFKSTRELLLGKRAKFNYMKKLMNHTAWVTLGDDDSFNIQVGRYIPEEWQEPVPNKQKETPSIENEVSDETF